MSAPHFTLYVKPGCGWCDDATDWLDEHGFAYDELDVYADPAAYAEMRLISGQTLCPTLVAGNEMLPDFDTGQLKRFLQKHGWLAAA